MRLGTSRLHQLGSTTKEGTSTRLGHHSQHFTLLSSSAGKGQIADLLTHWQRFASQRRLIHAQIVAVDQLGVGGNNIAQTNADHIARH